MIWLIGACSGLLMGLAVQRAGLAQGGRVRCMLRLKERLSLRTLLFALSFATWGVAALGYLAVLDVDHLAILPLHSGVWIGGAVTGMVAGLIGMTPVTALASIGGGRLLTGICTTAGCILGAFTWTLLAPFATPLQTLFAPSQETMFRVTLTSPFLWSGGFGGQACLGAVWFAAALCVRPAREKAVQPAAHEEVPWVLSEDASKPSTEEAATLVPNEDAPEQPSPSDPPDSISEEEALMELDEFDLPEDEIEDPDTMEQVATQDARLAQLLGKSPLSAEADPAMQPVPKVRKGDSDEE